ncbi:ATP-binding cassette domain-containing protein [Mycetocola tolaasinivorans]|uniref:ATP-binding cassette domain-containing protein n=2 Tax=Mycetocola tolaasinivorans TaxID=76635 RepID=A0A3L7A4R3_9MICO|nr:ATP-binding cassette domain-containing protein [Mycetocola tolaasinivorans]
MRRLIRNPLFSVPAAVLLLIVLAAIFADLIAPMSPTTANLSAVNIAPGGEYLLGGDGAGRDVLSRLIFAGRLTLLGSATTVGVAIALGVTAGLIAGYVGGWFDQIGGWVANLLIVLPGTIVLVALFAVVGPNVILTMVILGFMMAPNFFRVVRNQVIAVKNELYVDAARVSGLSNGRIIARHILSVIRAPIIILGASVGGAAIVVQAGLEFLGLGDPSTPTWGGMLLDAFNNLYVGPHLMWPPGIMIGITAISLLLIANAVRDALAGTDRSSRRPRRRTAISPVTGAPRSTAPTAVLPAAAGQPEPLASTAAISTLDAPAILKDTAEHGVLEISNLKVAYATGREETEVVHGVSLTLERGTILGLVGESGSGKTQIALSTLGLLPAGGAVTGGSIRINGREIVGERERVLSELRGKTIGYIPQEPMSNLDPSFTIGSQLVEPMRLRGDLSKAAAKARALELLDRVGIVDPARVFKSYPHQISGGMAQRVLIAGAVACEPELLIADEPTTALDVTVQAEILELIRDLQRERNLSVLIVTHNFGVVADLCDSVAVMRSGEIVEHGSVADIFARPRHEYTRLLLGSGLENAPIRTLAAAPASSSTVSEES